MRTSIRKRAENFIKEKSRRRYWKIAVAGLSLVVVAGTAWVLMSPARALMGDTYCGLEEHVHEDSCYESVLICGQEEGSGAMTTGEAAGEIHRHDESCYEEVRTLVCGQEESAGHTHTDACYTLNTKEELICTLEEGEEHTHTDECYLRTEERVLSCGQEESAGHTHTDACYVTERKLICGKEETPVTTAGETTAESGHVHDESCYERTLVCGKEEHKHEDACHIKPAFYCGQQVHVHTENCYDTEGNPICGQADLVIHAHNEDCYSSKGALICPLPEVEEHAHTDACYQVEIGEDGQEVRTVICGKPEAIPHVHTDECLDEDGWLICGKPEVLEHVHSESCFVATEEKPVEKNFGGDGFTVKAVYNKKAEIPERAALMAERVTEEEEELYAARRTELTEYLGEEAAAALNQMYRIGFYIRGQKMKPKDSVVITLQLLGGNALEAGVPVTVIGFNDAGGAERIEIGRSEDGSINFRLGEYTEFAVGYEVAEAENPPAEGEVPGETQAPAIEEGPELPVISDKTYPLSQTYDYEDSDLQIRFRVEGEVILPAEAIAKENGLSEGEFTRPGEERKKASGTGAVSESGSTEKEDQNEMPPTAAAEGSGEENIDPQTDAAKETTQASAEESSAAETMAEGIRAAETVKAAEATGAAETTAEETTQAAETTAAAGATETGDTDPSSAGADLPAKGEDPAEPTTEADVTEPATEPEPVKSTLTVYVPGQEAFEEKLDFQVKPLEEGTEAYAAVAAYEEDLGEAEEKLLLQVLSYSLQYDGTELDLSNCTVTMEILPTQNLLDAAKEANAAAIAAAREGGEETAEEPEIPEEDLLVSDGVMLEAIELCAAAPAADEAAAESGETADPEEAGVENTDAEDPEPEGDDPAGEPANADGAMAIGQIQTYSSSEEENAPMTFTMDSTSMTFAVRAMGGQVANPPFTVQYYANLVVARTTGTNALPVIDTSGGKLPVNGNGKDASPNGNSIKNLFVDNNGNVETETKLTEVYEARDCEYIRNPTINYFDALRNKPGYKLREVWVLKEGKTDPTSIDPEDWDRYPYSEDLHFTNREVSGSAVPKSDADPNGKPGYVWIKDNAVLRLVYDPTTADPNFAAAFYDYDITNGYIYNNKANATAGKETGRSNTSAQGDGTWYVHTAKSGINSDGNYEGKVGSRLAFGNANTGTGYQHEIWKGNLLNKYNGTQSGHPSVDGSYKGCTFGLADDLSEDGKIVYSDGVAVPNLFNDGAATGKTSYDIGQYSLKFNRVGDTYTLTAVNGTNATRLDSFNHPGYKTSNTESVLHTHIWTNNFWPMDSAPSFGTDKHDLKFGHYPSVNKRNFSGMAGANGSGANAAGAFPQSDDGLDHNSYFGMRYTVGFELSEDYVGPLEYYFFGDDDMWVFLSQVDVDANNNITRYYNSTLVCDIGGTHSSVGEYVNLWDYMKEPHKHTEKCYGEDGTLKCGREEGELVNKDGKWALTFFYTERGESGSTCWMQFTLPSATSLNPETTDDDYGELKVEKTVTAVEGDNETVVDNNDEFTFRIELKDAAGQRLADDYAYVKYDKNGNDIGADLIVWDGAEFTLKNGEYIIIRYLPQGTKYTITEMDTALTVTQIPSSDPNDPDGFDESKAPSDTKYLTDIAINGEPAAPGQKDLENSKIAEGSITQVTGNKVQYNNKFFTYALPKTGGAASQSSYTMAGISFLLAGGLMYRKKTKSKERKRRTRV